WLQLHFRVFGMTSFLGHRNHSGHGSYSLNYATQADDSYDAYPITSGWEDEWWPEGMYGEHYEDAWDEQLGWWEDEWSGHEGLQATTTAEDLSAEDQERLREAQQAERVAENLAAEAQRTWTEAQRATQQLRRDRGFGAVTSSSKGACFECGGPHLARDCPHRRSGFKGKGKSKGGYQATMDDPSLYYQFKGKGKGKSKKGYWSEAQAAWTKGKQKGKGKGKDPLRTVNAYSNEYFIGGLELRDRFDLNSTSMASSSPSTAMLDSGATASAAPEAVVQSLVTAVLAQDRQARIELDQASRPYFRFGNGKWGRALCRVTIQSRASGHLRSFALYTLPNPAEYYQAQFDKSTLVPILIGMDFIGPEGVGMLIDFATGLAMFTKESSPEIFQLNVNSKGHYTLDLVQYLTRGHKVEAILAASTKASAKPKNRARSLDKTRIMKLDPRDPRANPRQWPCYGQHEPGAPQSNMHGQWIHCQHCDLRLLYTPRKGSPSNTTAVVNAAMVTRMLKGLQPMLGNTKPAAKICHHMMAKITAEEVLQKAVTQLLAGYPSQPPTTSATPTSSTWGMVNDDYDQELIQAASQPTPLFMGKKLMAMAAMMTTATSSLLLGLQMSGRDCLWEISGAPHCWLSLAAEEHGLSSFPVNLRNGFDIYHKDTWARLRDLRRERKPLKLWFSLPFTKWCSWTSVNYNNPEGQEKLATARRKERRLLWEVNQFIKEAMYEDPAIQIYFEWPWPNNGWKQRPMEDLQEHMADQGTPWLSCRVDGCNYGLRTEDGNQFIKRPWLIRTTDECFHRVFRAKVCPGNHGIHADVSKVTAASSFYPWRLVQAIARHWRDQLAPARHHRLLLQREEIPQRAGGDDLEDADHLGYLPTEHLAVEDEVEEEHDLLTMKEDERLIVEHMAREARLRQDFSMDTCQVIMMELAHRLGCASSRHGRWPQGSPLHVVFGGYSHGKFGGLTTSTTKFPEVVKFLNLYLMHYNPRGQWSSLMVTFNGRALPHRDHHNMKNTTNLLHCLGNFEGGGLWIQSMDSEVSTSDTRRKLPDGIMALGKVADANRKFVTFRPEVFHATQPWTGYRVAISAYTTRLLFDMDSEARQRLRDLGFPMLSKAPVGAPDLLPAQVEEVELEGVDPRELRDWEAQVAKFHKAAGHPTNRNLARIVKDAGHPGWKVEVALRHQCPACLSLKPGGTSSGQVPPASTQTMYAAWEAVGVDSGEWVPPGSRTKVKFLLFMDLATKLRVICPLFTYNFLEMRAESGGDLIRSFSERWLGVFPKPKILVLDAAKSFVSDAVHEFASSVNILLSYVAEKEAWAHGTVEAGVQDVKMTASAIYLDAMDQDPYVTLHLATSALNSTEYTAGFSSFQWAYGKEYSLTDEDVRTYTAANFKDEWRLLTFLVNQMRLRWLHLHAGYPARQDSPQKEDVNDYDDTEIKRPRLDENWVELLKAEATQESKFDLFHAMEATEEFMKIEFDLDVPKSNRQKKMLLHNPTAYLVRKMKDAEVVLSKLSPGERELFRRAKAKEVESFIKNEAVRRCTDDAEIRRAYADQELWTTGVQELRDALGVGSEEVMRILRNIYGSTTAPRGLWLDLHNTLTKLGAEPVLGERCLWVWKSATEQDGPHAKAIGVMGGHVDDFHRIGDDSPEWLSIKESVNKAYKWGTAKVRSYRHAGTDVVTVPDELGHDSIEVNQDYYTEAIPDIDIDPDRLRMDGDMNHKEINACRGSLGALQWAATQSQPLVCARCSLLTSELATNPTMEVAREIQALIGELRAQPTKLVFRKFPDAKDWRDIVFISMGDQAHNNRPKGDSTGGLLTLMAGPSCVDGRVCPMSLLAWRTWKLKRKAISSNDAEVQAMLEAEDSNFRTRLLWSGLHGAGQGDSGLSLRRDLVQHVEQQVVNIKGIMCTDSKGGFDAIEVNESPLLGLSNTRAALQAYQLRGNLRRAAGDLRWVASDYDLADALTKKRPDCRVGLTRFLQTGVWCIKYDPQFQSAKKNKKAGRTAVGEIDDYLGRDPSSSWLSVMLKTWHR
ncbi:unnamed protein product, partial [Symbiodinium microadriaticum]